MTLPEDTGALPVEVRRGAPTEEELAALVAVLTEAYAGEAASAEADDEGRANAWAVSTRGLRAPLRRDLGWAGLRG